MNIHKKVSNKTVGECLRNNWNSIGIVGNRERSLRIQIQNNFSRGGDFDLDFYMDYCWNERAEELLNEQQQ